MPLPIKSLFIGSLCLAICFSASLSARIADTRVGDTTEKMNQGALRDAQGRQRALGNPAGQFYQDGRGYDDRNLRFGRNVNNYTPPGGYYGFPNPLYSSNQYSPYYQGGNSLGYNAMNYSQYPYGQQSYYGQQGGYYGQDPYYGQPTYSGQQSLYGQPMPYYGQQSSYYSPQYPYGQQPYNNLNTSLNQPMNPYLYPLQPR